MQRGPRKTCFAGKTNLIPATIQKQLVQSDGLFLRFAVRKQGLLPLSIAGVSAETPGGPRQHTTPLAPSDEGAVAAGD